jgi:hypothetical protein
MMGERRDKTRRGGRGRVGARQSEKSRKREREVRGERVDVDGRWRKALIRIIFLELTRVEGRDWNGGGAPIGGANGFPGSLVRGTRRLERAAATFGPREEDVGRETKRRLGSPIGCEIIASPE